MRKANKSRANKREIQHHRLANESLRACARRMAKELRDDNQLIAETWLRNKGTK